MARIKTPEITITAPQGWGKGWVAEQIARQLSAWKGGSVAVLDGEFPRRIIRSPHRWRRGSLRKLSAELKARIRKGRRRIVARIRVIQP